MIKFRSRSKSSRGSSRGGSQGSTGGKADYFHSPRTVTTSSTPRPEMTATESSSRGYEFRNSRDLDRDIIPVPVLGDGRIQTIPPSRSRSKSATRASQLLENGGGEMQILGRRGRDQQSNDVTARRSKSVGRAPSRHNRIDSTEVHHVKSEGSSVSGHEKKRKSKMEKIRQLQAKNELYKEEFKRVQKDRKKLRKDIEAKTDQITTLTKEMDEHIAESTRLKGQLSEALKELEQIDEDAERDKTTIDDLAKELDQTKQQLSEALSRVSTLTDDVTDLREYVRRKDEQIEMLTQEVSDQENRILTLEEENDKLTNAADKGKKDGKIVGDLVEENKKLQEELGVTLQRAANMVKEREDAISDLLKENDEVKTLLSSREKEQEEGNAVTQEDLGQMREELDTVNASLEQVQDRNVLLEEEIEAWLTRGAEMEGMLDKLKGDLETWQKKCKDAEDEISEVQRKLVNAKAETDSAKAALCKAEAKHKEQVADLESKHKAEITELQEKAHVERIEKNSTADSQQAMLLKAVADRQKKSSSNPQASWRRFLNKSDDEEDDLDENQKRIKELEQVNSAQEEEIRQLKSELVRLRSTYNESSYMNKKKIERLSEENEVYAVKIAAYEKQIDATKSD